MSIDVSYKTIEISNAKIKLLSYGSGKPLFLIPGWPFSSRIYELLRNYFSDKFRVTSLDFPGWAGKSMFTKRTKESFKIDSHLNLIKEVLEKVYSKNDKFDIGGISIGGTLSLLLALKNKQINKIIVSGSPFTGQEITKNNRFEVSMMKTCNKNKPLRTLIKNYYVYTLSNRFKKYISANNCIDGKFKNGLKSDFKNLDPKFVLDFAFDFFKKDYSDFFRLINNEVILIGADKDVTFFSNMQKRLSSDILKNALYVEVNATNGHYLLIENTQLFSQAIIENI